MCGMRELVVRNLVQPSMKALVIFLLALPAVFAAEIDCPDEPDPTIRDFLSADADRSAKAKQILLRSGTTALERLRSVAKDSERIRSLIQEIEKAEPQGLAFSVGLPKEKITVASVNSADFRYVIRVRNRNAKPVVLYPFFSAQLLDAAGKPVKFRRRLGRGGLRMPGHPLQDISFVTIESGKTWSVKESLRQYMHDPSWILGWNVPAAGKYTLVLTYEYRLAQSAGLEDKKHDAHKAVALKHAFRQEITVQKTQPQKD
jgi:hypothetical protein